MESSLDILIVVSPQVIKPKLEIGSSCKSSPGGSRRVDLQPAACASVSGSAILE
jgi:hypothetical protein